MKYIGIGDFFLIAERVLSDTFGEAGHSASELLDHADLLRLRAALDAPQATEDGAEWYPELHQKAAILCVLIARNRPLPYGNTAVALSVMRQFIAENGGSWSVPPGGDNETVSVLEAMADYGISTSDFALWVAARLT